MKKTIAIILALAFVCMAALMASAEDDSWTDPVGERIAFQEAQKVYDFLGLDRSLTQYHIREGAHGLTREDWLHYLDFADKHLKKEQ